MLLISLTCHGGATADVTATSDGIAAPPPGVERGRYLTMIGACNDCHTPGFMENDTEVPESEWLTGSRVGWRGAWGTTYASNLRIFAADFDEQTWVDVLRARYARPPMPWASLHAMTDDDLRSLYRYLRALGVKGERMPEASLPGEEAGTPYYVMEPQGEGSTGPHHYPLATALILNGHVAVVDLPAREIRELDTRALIADEADLSPDKKKIVFSAREGAAPHRLFLADASSGELTSLPARDDTDYRWPRFADEGRLVYFSVGAVSSPESARCYHVRRARVIDWSVSEPEQDDLACSKIPAGLAHDRAAVLGSSEAGALALRVVSWGGGVPQEIATGLSTDSEIAASPDGRTIAFTRVNGDRQEFWAIRLGLRPRRLSSVPSSGEPLQGHFLCPKDMLFTRDGKLWALDTWTGKTLELSGFRQVAIGRKRHIGVAESASRVAGANLPP